MKPIEDRLRETIGLDATSVGPSLIHRAVRRHMRRLGLKRSEDYRQVLDRSAPEWDELVEAVVVTETWFFREPDTIASFVGLVRDGWLPAHPGGTLRVLSVPCSSGEEPFSLVMALLDAGVPSQRFQVDAVDISACALARAATGLYSKNSFRGKDLAFRARYFRPREQGFVLDRAVRKCVRFYQGNIFSDGCLNGLAGYDFVFCRNLLIYLAPPMRQKALAKVAGLLAPEGLLFVGPAEQPLATAGGFATATLPTALACRKGGSGQRSARGPRQRSGAASGSFSSEIPPCTIPDSRAPAPSSARSSPARAHDLEMARRLAEAGRLKEAADICEAHLRKRWASAQAYYLLGLVREASGQLGAIDCYRKALYLEPDHYESLLQMALILHKTGDAARAHTFKRRAQRSRVKP